MYDAKDYAEKTAETGIILMDIEEMKIDDRLNSIEINEKIKDLKNKYEFLVIISFIKSDLSTVVRKVKWWQFLQDTREVGK